jgi:hypothetical protein
MDQSKDSRAGEGPSPDDAQTAQPKQESGGPETAGTGAAESEHQEGHSVGWYAAWATIVSLPVGVLTAIAIALFSGGSTPTAAEGSREPQLERIDLIARNGLPPHKPAVELLVHNGGRGRAVISRAKIEILRVYPLPLCFTQGELPISERYGTEIPADAEAGDVIEVPLHQQIGRDGADRFQIQVGVSSIEPDGELPGLFLFELSVSLVHDGESDPLQMGNALIAAPELPYTTQYLLRKGEFPEVVATYAPASEYVSPVPPRKLWATQMPCWQANGRTALQARDSQAAMSPQLRENLDSAGIPSFAELES